MMCQCQLTDGNKCGILVQVADSGSGSAHEGKKVYGKLLSSGRLGCGLNCSKK